MKRIDSAFFVQLGGHLHHLKNLAAKSSWSDNFAAFVMAEAMLRFLIEKGYPIELTYCRNDAERLRAFLVRVINSRQGDVRSKKDAIDVHEWVEGRSLAETFETSLITELPQINTYFVSPIGVFSTSALLNKMEEMFGEHRDLLPSISVSLIREGGKCLAFSLGSAAAFHFFGALESVLKQYYDKLSGGKPRPKKASMGVYINALAAMEGVDEKLIAAVRQVKDLHRNPTIHFETILTIGQAQTLVGMIHSAISTVLDVVSKLPPAASSTREP